MKNNRMEESSWKQIFSFTKDGKLQNMDLMYAFFLGLAVIFLNFIIGNRLTILFESVFPAMSRTGKNWLGILVPAAICALAAMLIFRLFRKKNIVLIAYWFGLLLILLIFILLLFEFDRESLELLLPAYIGIFIVPAAAGAAAVSFLFRNWARNHPAPAQVEQTDGEGDDLPQEADNAESDEPDYSGWRQFR